MLENRVYIVSLACFLVLGACASTQDTQTSAKTPLAAGWSSDMTEDECKRRAQAMAEGSESMRQGPHEIVNDVRPVSNRWEGGNDPCGTEAKVLASAQEEDARDQAKLQAKAFLSQGDIVSAKESLVPAYSERLQPDKDLDALTKEVAVAWDEMWRKQSASIKNVVASRNSMCVLGLKQSEGEIFPKMLWKPVPEVAVCGLPASLKKVHPDAQLNLVVRRRLGPGRFAPVRKQALGSTLEAAQNEVVEIVLDPLMAEELGGVTRAYLELTLVSARPGFPERAIAKQGVFIVP